MNTPLPLDFGESNKFPLPADSTDPMTVGKVRRIWHQGDWFYSVVDVVAWAMGRDADKARTYWKNLSSELRKAGSELVANPYQLPMLAQDGKMRKTDVGNAELILRIVQEIPGTTTNDLKDWLAQVGAERLEEEANPDKGLQNSLKRFVAAKVRQGFSTDEALKFAQMAVDGRIVRNTLTDALKACVVGTIHFGTATNTEYVGMFGKNADQIRQATGFKNARDGMTIEGRAMVTAAEHTITRLLGERESVTFNEAVEIIRLVAKHYRFSVESVQQLIGIDLATGQALLS